MVVLPMSRPTLTLFFLLRTNNRNGTPRLLWQTSRLRQRPATAFFLFSFPHCAATSFLSSTRYKRHSKCAFAYIIIIIQSRAAFNPCCLFYTKKIVFFAQKAELFVNMCRFSRKKAAAQRFVQWPCTGGTISNGSACALAIFSGSSFLRPTRKIFLECSILLTGSRNSAPEPATACARGKRRSRHTGKACCGSPADRGTARWAPVPAAPAPAGKAQSPCRRAEWGT